MSHFQMKDFGNFEKIIVGYYNPMETCLTQKKNSSYKVIAIGRFVLIGDILVQNYIKHFCAFELITRSMWNVISF